MKEKIYTIPVTEAFSVDCECPMCVLEDKLENEYITYFLGPSLMEPDCRMETNEKGFCRRHYEQLYNKQENRLGLGLVLDTHLTEQNKRIREMCEAVMPGLKEDSRSSMVRLLAGRLSNKQRDTARFLKDMSSFLQSLENKCSICSKLEYTMDRYMDVTLYLWIREEDFRRLFNSRKGFCLKHFRQLLEAAAKYLNDREAAVFMETLIPIQLKNLERVREEVHWFTEKFDYRNHEAPWGNSKDAVPRSIQKLAGNSSFKA